MIFLVIRNTDTFFPKSTELDVVVLLRDTNTAVRNPQIKMSAFAMAQSQKRGQFCNLNHGFLGPSRSFKCCVTQKVKNE